jgi:SAM-dependent methyltransferase
MRLAVILDSAIRKPVLVKSLGKADATPSVELRGICPACGSAEASLLFSATDRFYATTDKVFQIIECRQCRLIRLHPRPTPGELRDYYPPQYWFVPGTTVSDRLEQWLRRLVLSDHLRFVERALNESEAPGMVLDVGCGDGLFLQMLAGRGRRNIAGLDFSLDAATAAWTRAGLPVVCGTLSRAPFAPGSCAMVTMFHVLQHLYHPASYLDAAHELLAPEGRLIVQVPNVACWQFLLLGEHWNGIDVPRHLLDFRLADLEALLDNCGFEVLRRKHFSLRDNPAGMASSLAPRLDLTARRLRGAAETTGARLWRDAMFVALAAATLPFTLLEAACRAGSTVIVEARKKS